MKVLFVNEDAQVEGSARELTALGAFVVTDQPRADGACELTLDSEAGSLALMGDVVRVTEEGFAVAFHPLSLDMLERLQTVLNPDQEQQATEAEPEDGTLGDLQLTVQGEDWSPPVSEPVLHQWRPEQEFAQPAPEDTASSWANLPTLAPTVTASPAPKQAPAAAAPQPSQSPQQSPSPEQAAIEHLSASTQTEPPAQAAPQAPASQPQQEPSGADQRQYERHDRSIPVSFENLTGLIKEFTHNISYGGMFVYSQQPLAKDSETAVTLVHPVHGERLTLLAKVVHTSQAPTPDPATGESRYGLGLEFRLPLSELKRMLADFIGSHQKQAASVSTSQVVVVAQQILDRGADSPYALLGLDDSANPDTVRQAYFNLVDRFHPDRYFGKVSASDRKLLEELFRRLTKAYEQLTA